MNASPERYDGLDLFRGVCMLSVVLLHVHVFSGGSPSDVILRIRDFAFPVLIMGSFFVMAVSFDRKPGRPFREIVGTRVVRLLVPSLIWSYLYWLGYWVLRPWLLGQPPVMPPLRLVLTGTMHFWFLHMVFGVTVVSAPVLGWVTRGQLSRWPVVAACAAATLATVLWVEPRLLEMTAHLNVRALQPGADPAPDLLNLIERVAPFLAYIPAGLAIGLAHHAIDRWYLSSTFRIATLVAAVVALAVHILPAQVPLSREAYAIAVFIAVLRPLRPRPFTLARTLARWSFVVYILHYAGVIVFNAARQRAGIPGSEINSIAGAIVVVAASLAAGVVLRRLLPFDWLLPLVSVTPKPVRVRLQSS